jgi:hypothetical protein
MSRFDEDEDSGRRRLIKALAAGLFSVALPGRSAMASLFGSRPGKLLPEQSIYRINGSVTVNGVEATLQTRIGPSDTIQTAADSEIIFVVGGNAMILGQDGHLVMEAKSEILVTASDQISALMLTSGHLLSVSRSQGLSIETPLAKIGLQGTGVYLESDPDMTYFCTCYGKTTIESKFDPLSVDTVVSKHHDRPLYITANEDAGKNIRKASFKNHTDQELMLIESLVGRSTPFVFAGDDYSSPRKGYDYNL